MLFFYELKKIWGKKDFIFYFTCLIVINYLLLWMSTMHPKDNIHPTAYKNFYNDIYKLSEDEKELFINEAHYKISSLMTIDNILKISKDDYLESQKLITNTYSTVFDEFFELYKSQKYSLYTDNLQTEFKFLTTIKNEFDSVSNYEKFLSSINAKQEHLSNFSIFSGNSKYDILNINAAQKAYQKMNNITITYIPQIGIHKALNFIYSDIIIIRIIFLLSFYIIRDEIDNNIIVLIRTTKKGKLYTALAKLFALSISLLVAVFIIYTCNLLYCETIYSLGSLYRSIQSVPYLMRSTLKINIFNYMVIFIFTKWSALSILGTWIILSNYISQNIVSGFIISILLPFISYLVRNSIPATSYYNSIKYINIISYMVTNEILGTYRNIYWFGSPVNILILEMVSAIIMRIIIFSVFLVIFNRNELPRSKSFKITLKKFNFINHKSSSVFKEEFYKIFIMNGGILFILIYLIFNIHLINITDNYMSSADEEYAYYMKNLTGYYDVPKYTFMSQEYDNFKSILEIEQMLHLNMITQEEYSTFVSFNNRLFTKFEAYKSALREINNLTGNNTTILYDDGYEYLFDVDNLLDKSEYVLTVCLIILILSGTFSIEKSTGFIKLMITTKNGRTTSVRIKTLLALFISSMISFISLLPRLYKLTTFYGIQGIFLDIKNISAYKNLNYSLSILCLVLLLIFMKILSTFTVAMITLSISLKCNDYISTVMYATITLILPIIFYILGFSKLQWLTFFPIFHFTGNLSNTVYSYFSLCYVIISLFFIRECYKFLNQNIGKI